ncbi:MAG: lamin tail domain-containing protein [Patescibacteria group bacterium]|jgi:hypothetical protein
MAKKLKKKAVKRLKKPKAKFRIVLLKPEEKKTDILKKRVMKRVKKAKKKLKDAGKALKKTAQKEKLKKTVRAGGVKVAAAFLVIGLNWAGLAAVGETFASFNDAEVSGGDSFTAGSLDFSLTGATDFSTILPDTNAIRTIDIAKIGSLDFQYRARAANISGALCSSLEIKDNIGGNYQPLSSFVSTTTLFSLNNAMTFTAHLTSDDAGLMSKTCEFNLIFSGWQGNLAFGAGGFTSEKTISNTINSGSWGGNIADHLVINEVYYDVDSGHGQERYNEWVELYNPTAAAIDLTGWKICDGGECDLIPATSTPYIIQPNGYAVITASSTTWGYWSVPGNAVKIVLDGSYIGSGLNDGGDWVRLINPALQVVDSMSYGTDTTAFARPGVAEGHSLARTPAGKDTDTAGDWEDLSSPNPGTNPHTVLMNEILPNPAGDEFGEDADPMPKGEWVELYNYGEYEINLSQWKIKNQMGRALAITAENTSGASAVIHPGEWLVVYRNGSDKFEMLDNGDTITLADEKDRPVDLYTYTEPAPENKSYARIPDFSGDWVDPIPTPGKANQEEEAIIELFNIAPEVNLNTSEMLLDGVGEDARAPGENNSDNAPSASAVNNGEATKNEGSEALESAENTASDETTEPEAKINELTADKQAESKEPKIETPAMIDSPEAVVIPEEPVMPDIQAVEIINNTENNEATVSALPPPAEQAVSEPATEPTPINILSESAPAETG